MKSLIKKVSITNLITKSIENSTPMKMKYRSNKNSKENRSTCHFIKNEK